LRRASGVVLNFAARIWGGILFDHWLHIKRVKLPVIDTSQIKVATFRLF
jgi:hypothetical protein